MAALSVVLISSDRMRVKAFLQHPNDPVSALRLAWADAWGVPGNSFILSHSGRAVGDAEAVGDLETSPPGLVALTVEDKDDLRQLSGAGSGREACLHVGTHPQHSHAALEAIGVEDGASLLLRFPPGVEGKGLEMDPPTPDLLASALWLSHTRAPHKGLLKGDFPRSASLTSSLDNFRPDREDEVALKVTMGDDSYEWTFPQPRVAFSEVVRRLRQEREDVGDADELSLHCSGCERRLTVADEPFQVVPAACCWLRSLELECRVGPDDAEVRGLECSGSVEELDELSAQVQRLSAERNSLTEVIELMARVIESTSAPSRPLPGLPASPGLRRARSEPVLAAPAAPCVLLAVWRPLSDVASVVPVPAAPKAARWADLLPYAARQVSGLPAALAFQDTALYLRAGVERRAERVLGLGTAGLAWRDAEDGAKVPDASVRRVCRRFLGPDSPVRPCAGAATVVSVLLGAGVATVARADPPRLEEATPDLLSDWAALAAVWGLERRREGDKELFLELNQGLCAASSGELFSRRAALARRRRGKASQWRRLLLVLREGDAVPRAVIPQGRSIRAWQRRGVAAAVRGRAVHLDGPQACPCAGEWIESSDIVSNLEMSLTKAIRRRKRWQWLD